VLFVSAGTIDYWQAWIYLGVNAVASVPLILFISKDPILLENRAKAGPAAEQRTIQKIIVLCATLPAIAAFVIPRARSPFRLVRCTIMAFHRGRLTHSCRDVDGVAGVQGKLFRLRESRSPRIKE
jgi:hypothetical protein